MMKKKVWSETAGRYITIEKRPYKKEDKRVKKLQRLVRRDRKLVEDHLIDKYRNKKKSRLDIIRKHLKDIRE